MASVGQELLDVPLPDMVTKLALGIAEAQRALDENSVETAQILADTTIEVIPALHADDRREWDDHLRGRPIRWRCR